MRIPDTPLGDDTNFPFRPAHPDFARLTELVWQLDAQGNEAGVEQQITTIIDNDSLAYLAINRAGRVHQLLDNTHPITGMAALYIEAFLMGYRYHERYGKDHRGSKDEK